MSIYFQEFPTMQYDLYDDGHMMELVDIFRTVRPKANIKDDILLYSKYTIQDGERPDHISQKLYGSPDYFWTFFMVNENLVNLYADWPLSRKEYEDMLVSKYSGYVLVADDHIATKFKHGETLQGLSSGATGIITQKDVNTNTIRIESVTGEFRSGEMILGLMSGDSVVIQGQTEFYNATRHYVNTSTGFVTHKNDQFAMEVTFAEYEKELNDTKSQIRVIRPQYITRVAQEFFKQINPEVNQ